MDFRKYFNFVRPNALATFLLAAKLIVFIFGFAILWGNETKYAILIPYAVTLLAIDIAALKILNHTTWFQWIVVLFIDLEMIFGFINNNEIYRMVIEMLVQIYFLLVVLPEEYDGSEFKKDYDEQKIQREVD